MKAAFYALCILAFTFAASRAQTAWQADLDSNIRSYQTTDFGLVLAGTERRLYAIDGRTGERLWQLEKGATGETGATPVPNTDVVLLSRDLGSKSRLEALDIMTGARLWQSEKIKGEVMQLAADPENDLIALVAVREPVGASGSEFKRKPSVHVLRMSSGEELWRRELDGEIEMMPTRFGENNGKVTFTLDNYRAPLLLDGRLFLFYEGATSFDALTGKEREREKFKVNENGLALTEADPVVSGTYVFTSGRGKIRAVSRRTGRIDWKSDDFGTASETALVGNTLYVRTGGRFTQLRDGEAKSKGPFGVAAVDAVNGKTKWRYKSADKGITNFAFADADTIAVADSDDVFFIDAASGKKLAEFPHKLKSPEFVLFNESGAVVVGGREEIAAFAYGSSAAGERSGLQRADGVRELWRDRHKAPARGAFRTAAGIALRAAAIYFRYGGAATSALGLARSGLNIASAVNAYRWSGLTSRFGSFDLTTLASNSARDYAVAKFYSYGAAGRTPGLLGRVSNLRIRTPDAEAMARAASPPGVQESIFDRLDPARQAERLSDYLLRKRRLSELKGNYMYFYTDLPKPFDRKGLVGVNVHNGKDARFAAVGDPDPAFLTDEALGLLYSANGSRLRAFELASR